MVSDHAAREGERTLREHALLEVDEIIRWSSPAGRERMHAMLRDRERCLAAGCDEFATKPIDGRPVLARVWLGCSGSVL